MDHAHPLRIRKSSIFALAAPVYILLVFSRFYIDNSQLSNFIAISLILCGLLLLGVSALQKPLNSAIFVLIYSFTVAGLSVLIFDHNFLPESLIQFLANLGFAWAILHSKMNKKFIFGILLFIMIFFFVQIYEKNDPEYVFATVSRNYISVIIILSISLYIISCRQNNVFPSIWPPLASMIILLWSIGRAGILSGCIIIIGLSILRTRNILTIFLAGISVFSLLIVASPNFIENASTLMVGIDRFERLSTKSQRNIINDEYVQSIGTYASEFLMGAPLDTIQAIQEVDGNPHNSFINLHIVFGITGFLIFLLALSLSSFSLLKRREYLLLLVLGTALFRSLFDSAAFHGPMDVIIFYCIFSGLKDFRVRVSAWG